MAEREKVVLAYSGGLDTSICIKWLMDEHDMDVIAVVGEVGQEHEGLEAVRQKALRTGAIEAYVVDMREEFVNEYLTGAIRANALYENKYPLLSALSRPVISKHLVRIAHEVKHLVARGVALWVNGKNTFHGKVYLILSHIVSGG